MRNLFSNFIKSIVYLSSGFTILLMAIIVSHISIESFPALSEIGLNLFDIDSMWRPMSSVPSYSIVNAVLGTLYISILAVLIAIVFGIGCSIFLNFYTPKYLSKLFLSFIDLIAGIPSVIFGFIGLSVLVKWFESNLDMTSGESVLAAGILLAIMLLPFVVSSCSESIEKLRYKYELSSLSLGISKEYFILKILLPSMKNSIVTAFMLAFGRGLGETMAVMMVVGNSPIYPKLLGRAQTIPALTALEMGSVSYGSLHMSALFVANLVLIFILIVVFGMGYFLKRRLEDDE